MGGGFVPETSEWISGAALTVVVVGEGNQSDSACGPGLERSVVGPGAMNIPTESALTLQNLETPTESVEWTTG
jgi:hypothetical protein